MLKHRSICPPSYPHWFSAPQTSPTSANFKSPLMSSFQESSILPRSHPTHAAATSCCTQNYNPRNRPQNRQLADRTSHLTDCNHNYDTNVVPRCILLFNLLLYFILLLFYCLIAVGWVSGIASDRKKNLTDLVMVWLSSGAKCK